MAFLYRQICIFLLIHLTLSKRPYCDDRDDNKTNHHYKENDGITSNYINTDFMGIPMSLVPGKCQSMDISSVGSQKWECKNANTLIYYEYDDSNCQSIDPIQTVLYDYNTSNMYRNKDYWGGFSCDYETNNFAKILLTAHTDNCTENFDLEIDADNMDIAVLYVAINTCGATDNTQTQYTQLPYIFGFFCSLYAKILIIFFICFGVDRLYCAKQDYQSEAKGAEELEDPYRYYGEFQFYTSDMEATDECQIDQFESQLVIDDSCSVLQFESIMLDGQV